MATTSTVLGLKLPGSSDPFLLSDFIGNWGILDASPGVFICTSTNRPNWSTAQAGRLIFMSDLKQLSYWNGSAWSDLRDSVPVFAGGSYINTAMNSGSSPTFNVLTFTTPRPCALAVFMSVTYQCANNKTQDLWQQVSFDGSPTVLGNFRDQIRFVGNSGDSSATAAETCGTICVIPSVTSGQHKLGAFVQVSSNYNSAVTLVGVKVMAFIALYSTGNSL